MFVCSCFGLPYFEWLIHVFSFGYTLDILLIHHNHREQGASATLEHHPGWEGTKTKSLHAHMSEVAQCLIAAPVPHFTGHAGRQIEGRSA